MRVKPQPCYNRIRLIKHPVIMRFQCIRIKSNVHIINMFHIRYVGGNSTTVEEVSRFQSLP